MFTLTSTLHLNIPKNHIEKTPHLTDSQFITCETYFSLMSKMRKYITHSINHIHNCEYIKYKRNHICLYTHLICSIWHTNIVSCNALHIQYSQPFEVSTKGVYQEDYDTESTEYDIDVVPSPFCHAYLWPKCYSNLRLFHILQEEWSGQSDLYTSNTSKYKCWFS